MSVSSTVADTGCRAHEIAAPASGSRVELLAIETRRSVREVAAVMRTAVVCSTCHTDFATLSAADRLCDDCRVHFDGPAIEGQHANQPAPKPSSRKFDLASLSWERLADAIYRASR